MTKPIKEQLVFGLDIGTRSIVGTVGYKEDNIFNVVAQYIKYHDTRAIIDGQVHDIEKVAETIIHVKTELEQQIDQTLSDVCIAAAGRVLKTVIVSTEYQFEEDTIITKEHIRTLVAGGIEKAYAVIAEETKEDGQVFNCVGYTVMHYYLNGFLMTALESHKGMKISADVIVTFLPQEVVDGLYSSVEKAGLQVINMTLEPIAAMNIAIPEAFRMLNIALVDIGAGTSDISITKDGSIIAYGMIPCAGDAITEVIMQHHLVDFKTAEAMKISSGRRKEVSYKDILSCKHKVLSDQLRAETQPIIKKMAGEIGKRIVELNGGKPVSAVFVVGGGGKFAPFITEIAASLKLPKERVALRGEEVLKEVTFLQDGIKKDSTLVTPIGICLNYYEQKNNLIFVYVNGERIKLYDNSKLSIVDAALKFGYPREQLFPRRGKTINFFLDGERRMIRGEAGEAAEIFLNEKPASINTPIAQHDAIQIKESTAGADAHATIADLPEVKQNKIQFIVNKKKVVCPRLFTCNDVLCTQEHKISDGDELRRLDYYTVEQLLRYLDIVAVGTVLVNREAAGAEEKIYENFAVELT